ncbi:MAG: hypothetical protein Q9165_003811 [Trypethelium subeluteriae]
MALYFSLFSFTLFSASNGQQTTAPVPITHITDARGRTALLWSSIGLAVLTSVLQGIISTVVLIAEEQDMWTFRFRIAKFEHWWWTAVGTLLMMSFGLIVISFLAGNNNDSVGVLALSTATAIVIVRYAIPSWRHRYYIRSRWLAWTGPSRTAISYRYGPVCGTDRHWERLSKMIRPTSAAPPSDDWGLALNPHKGIAEDPTAILNGLGEINSSMIFGQNWEIGPCVYDDGFRGDYNINSLSLLWGSATGFRPRVSRAINSMPQSLLKSRPFTVDGYNGEGLCLAMGILGRNKGLLPRGIVFDSDDSIKQARGVRRENALRGTITELENTSKWAPRPNKVMRSYYKRALEEQYGSLPSSFTAAATELALIFLDCSPAAIQQWLSYKLEQQSLEVNIQMSRPANYSLENIAATEKQLQTLYRAQYVSMILSINYWPPSGVSRASPTERHPVYRPDLYCFALLYLAEGAVQEAKGKWQKGQGASKPAWWGKDWVKARLTLEASSLQGNWHECAAWLLGLKSWPTGLEDWPH